MIKKLIYRSHYRGTKEGDYILSSFAKNMLDNCTAEELEMYNELLEYSDTKIHQWLSASTRRPPHLQKIIKKITEFHNLSNPSIFNE